MSKYFQWSEMVNTTTGYYNEPENVNIAQNIRDTMLKMDDVREAVDAPVFISSGYRSHAVNSAVGGSNKSDHLKGYAVDFVVRGKDPCDICDVIIEAGIQFHQLIAEYKRNSTWVHISFHPSMSQKVMTYRDGKYHDGLVRELEPTEAPKSLYRARRHS